MPNTLKFDREKFFSSYRTKFGKLKQSQVPGLVALLDGIESDVDVADVRWAAYMLATVKHECADRWRPIDEFGKGAGREYGKPVKVTDSHGKQHEITYYGRGYVQLTWHDNYVKMSTALGLDDDLVIHPERALEPEIAYRIMSYGMRKGSFTGKKLADFIHNDVCDYKNARKIINGLDKWQLIKGYAEGCEKCLRSSLAVSPPRVSKARRSRMEDVSALRSSATPRVRSGVGRRRNPAARETPPGPADVHPRRR